MAEHHSLEKPKTKAKIIALVLEGKSDSQVAAVVGGTRQAITKFRHRHQAEIVPVAEAVAAEIIQQTADMWITQKVERTRVLQELADLALEEIRTYGISTEKVTMSEDGGPHFTRDFRAAAVAQTRGLLKDAAIEEGQIVTPKGDTYNDNRSVVYIREVHTGGSVPLG